MKKRFLRNITLTALAALCWCGQGGAKEDSAALSKDIKQFARTSDGDKVVVGAAAVITAPADPTTAVARVDGSRAAFKYQPVYTAMATVKAAGGDSELKAAVINNMAVSPSGYVAAIDNAVLNKAALIYSDAGVFKTTQSAAVFTDAAGAAVAQVSKAIAASDTAIVVAACKNAAAEFTGDAGFALVKIAADKALAAVDAGTGVAAIDTKALKINPTVNAGDPTKTGPLAIANPATIDAASNVCMCYDKTLARFYAGLSNIKSGAVNGDCAVGVLVGYQGNGLDNPLADDGKIVFNSVLGGAAIAGTAAHITAGVNLIADKVDAAAAKFVAAYHVAVMHTSTGRAYLIVNGATEAVDGIVSSPMYVFAIPLSSAAGATKGYVTNLTFAGAPAGAADLVKVNLAHVFHPDAAAPGTGLTAGEQPYVVGQDVGYLLHTTVANYAAAKVLDVVAAETGIKDMQVLGDTVYVSLAGARGAVAGDITGEEQGIFSSTALFAETGLIRAWTPWERVSTGVAIKPVDAFSVSSKSGKVTFLDKTNGPQVVSQTMWNKGEDANALPAKLAIGEVYNVTAFDDETPGFKTEGANGVVPLMDYPQFAMMVATGDRKVALIQAIDAEDPVADFGAANMIVTFDGTKAAGVEAKSAELASLGRITCSEFTRNAAAAGNWLFVGGDGGVAVLRVTADGTGFGDAAAGAAAITDLKAEGLAAVAQSFKQLVSGDDLKASVRKLVSDGAYLYVMTKDKVFRITQDAASFTDAGAVNIPAANIKTIATIAGSMDDTAGHATRAWSDNDEFYDMMVIDNTDEARILVLATSKGVYKNMSVLKNNGLVGAGDDSALTHLGWARKVDNTGAVDFPLGPALKFDFKSKTRGGVIKALNDKAEGNLYVTALDADEENLCVYRFNVSNGAVKAIVEPYKSGGVVVPYFYKLGTVTGGTEFVGGADMAAQAVLYPEQGTSGDFVDQVAMGPDPDSFLPTGAGGVFADDSAINLKLPIDNGFNLAAVCKDPASGAIYVPGTFSGGVRVNE